MPRVAVTSSIDRWEGMAAELVARGLQPVPMPCIAAHPGAAEDVARMRAACDEVDLIVLDSTRPLSILWSDGDLPSASFAVSGPAVAAAVSQRGGSVSAVGQGTCVQFVVTLVDGLTMERVAFPHSADTDRRAILALRDAVTYLAAAPVYSTRPCAPTTEAVDAAVFVSPIAVHGWAMTRSFTGLAVAALGHPTRRALEEYDRQPDVHSRSPAYGELSKALATYLT